MTRQKHLDITTITLTKSNMTIRDKIQVVNSQIETKIREIKQVVVK